jgi:hypothetical protein
MTSGKRYVLLMWEGGPFTDDERKRLTRLLEQRYGNVRVIPVDGSDCSLVVKTDVLGAASMRESISEFRIGEKKIASVLTSGCIGKLKKRALESAASGVGEVSQ